MNLSDRDAPHKQGAAAGFSSRQAVTQSATVLQIRRKAHRQRRWFYIRKFPRCSHDEFAAGLAERLEPLALRGELGLEDLGPPW